MSSLALTVNNFADLVKMIRSGYSGGELAQDGMDFLAQVNQGSLAVLSSGKVLIIGGSKAAIESARCAAQLS